MNKIVKNLIASLAGILLLTLLATSCKNWMASDQFLSAIENDVSVANAKKINVYLRYANTKMGTTAPVNSDWLEEKVGVPFTISATTNDDYAFVKWAAFSVKDFPTSKQYSNFIYVSQDDYDENYEEYEYSSDEVKFENASASSTSVTVNVDSDKTVFIMPIVSARPVVVTSNPENNAENVVKNMTIRILFSKPLDEASLAGAFTISQGPIIISETNSDYVDITDHFQEPVLSKSKKMVSLQQKVPPASNPQQYYFDTFQKILINISNEIRDTDGNTMAEGTTITFKTNDKTDTVAPKITLLKANTVVASDSTVDFSNAYDYSDSVSAGSTRLEPSTIEAFDTAVRKYFADKTDKETRIAAMYSQRTKGHVYLSIESTEYTEDSGTATGDDASGSTITINSTLVVNADGTVADNGSNKPSIYTYADGAAYKFISGNTNAITADVTYKTEVDVNGNKKSVKGILVDYDLAFKDKLQEGQEVPDGLYRVDVWAVDANGNDGSTQGRIVSLYVIKDTTPPDVETEYAKVTTQSDYAPYSYYNSETLSTLKFKVVENKEIVDSSTSLLASDVSKMKWLFTTSSETPSASDSGWSYITQDTSGKVFSSAKAPAKDGPASVYLFLMDDMNNISECKELDSVYFDNTAANVSTIEWIPAETMTADAKITVNSTSNQYMEKALRIPFNEEYSGVKRIILDIKNESGESVSTNPFVSSESNGTEIYYLKEGESDLVKLNWENKTDSKGKKFTELQIPSDLELENITSGYLFIKNLHFQMASDAILTLSLNLYDAALNESNSKSISLSYDNTAPVIEKITINDLIDSLPYDGSSSKKYLSMNGFTVSSSSIIQNTASIKLKIKESGSGVNVITLKDDVSLTSNTILLLGEEEIDSNQYVFDLDNNTITFTDFISPVLQSDSSFILTIKNLHYKNTGSSNKNKVNIALKDFIAKSSSTSDSDTPDIYVDNSKPVFNSITIKDLDSTNADRNTLYTNEQTVNLLVSLKSEKDSGLKSITLTNALFTESSKVYVGTDATGTGIEAEFSTDKKTVTFNKEAVESGEQTYFITNIIFTNATNGTKTVSLIAKDLIGWTSDSVSKNITLDTLAPEISELNWVVLDTETTAGITKENIISKQKLHIPFVEVTSGISTIQFVVTNDEGTVYQTPVSYSSSNGFKIDYVKEGSTSTSTYTETRGTDTFTCNKEKSGSFEVTNLKISDIVTEGTYTIKVILTDIAENTQTIERTIAISNDSTAPVVTKIEIQGLVKAEDIVPTGSNPTDYNNDYWLTSDYFDEDDENSAKVTLYITINEQNSGLKYLTLSSPDSSSASGKPLFGTDSKIYIVTDSEYEEFSSDNYKYNSTRITFTKENQKLKGPELKFKITNLKFSQRSPSNKNFVLINASDVALNTSSDVKDAYSLESQELVCSGTSKGFYFNNKAACKPQITESSSLSDRAAVSGITAYPGYTNEDIVDFNVNISIPDGSYISGYNSFTLENATFITEGDDTSLVVITDGSTTVPSTNYIISADNKTITFKNENGPMVFRSYDKTSNIIFKNIKLDSTEQGTRSVGIKAKDLSGQESDFTNKSIILDTEEPLWEGATKQNPTNGSGPYVLYDQSNLNYIYPRPSSENDTAFGVTLDERNSDETLKRYFYQFSGNSIYLGLHVSDNISLYSDSSRSCVYKKSTTSSAASYTNVNISSTTGSRLQEDNWTGADNGKCVKGDFESGTYVVADKAGNISKEYTWEIVNDNKAPMSDYTSSLAKYITLQTPDEYSKVYRNSGTTSLSYSPDEINYAGCTSSSTDGPLSLISKKYLKKEGEYKIVVKIGSGLTNNDVTLNGTTGDTTYSALSDTKATSTSSPLDYYSISHLYGSYPTGTEVGDMYYPCFPANTKGPGIDATQTLTELSPADYFNFKSIDELGQSNFETSDISWRKYEKDSIDYTDGDIVSRVNSDGDIEIDIPNRTSPPLTLLLKDGCGNLNYVVLSTDDDIVTIPFNNGNGNAYSAKYGVSFYTDNKLGNSSEERKVLQNVGARIAPSNDTFDFTWGNQKYVWGNQTSSWHTSTVSPNKKLGFFIRDNIKKLTYYNPTKGDYDYKIALSVEGEDGVCFENRDITLDTDNYSGRAKILWKEDSGTPSYEEFLNNNNTSEWIYGTAANNGGKMTFIFDYPTHEKYDSFTNETPYYFWYLVEDRVGNYDINTIVNDENDEYNRWFCDVTAPLVTINGTKNSPGTITLENIEELVPANNGFRPYQDGNKVYVWGKSTQRSGTTYSTMKGKGLLTEETTLNRGTYNTIFNGSLRLPAFNLSIEDTTGIYAYYYCLLPSGENFTSAESMIPELPVSDTNKNGYGKSSSPVWFYGKGINELQEIGQAVPESDYDNYSVYAYSSSDDYAGTFTGTKVVPQIPVEALSEADSSATPYRIGLYVMDWVGNVTLACLGDSNVLYVKDSEIPVEYSASEYAESYVQGSHYMSKTSNSSELELRIAGKGKDSSSPDLKIYFPIEPITNPTSSAHGWFSDTGSGILGFELRKDDSLPVNVANANYDENGCYLSLSYDDYKNWDETSDNTLTYYYYDRVGNVNSGKIKGFLDNTSPTLSPKISLSNNENNENDESDVYLHKEGYTGPYTSAFDTNNIDSAKISDTSKSPDSQDWEGCYDVYYADTTGASTLKIKCTQNGEWGSDTRAIYLKKWSESAKIWEELASSTTSSTKGISADYTNEGIYQFSISDQTGNSTYYHFITLVDTAKPSFNEGYPKVKATKGIFGIKDDVLYYNEMEIQVSGQDGTNGSGVKSCFYSPIETSTESSTTRTEEIISAITSDTTKSSYSKLELINTSEKLYGYYMDTDPFTFQLKANISGTSEKIQVGLRDAVLSYGGSSNEYENYASVNIAQVISDYKGQTGATYICHDEYPPLRSYGSVAAKYKLFLTECDSTYLKCATNSTDDGLEQKITLTDSATTSVTYTPSASDSTSGVIGFIESSSNEKPEITSENFSGYTLKNSFTYSVGNNNTIPLDGTSVDKYYFAVDYAGNVSKSEKVTFKYDDTYTPEITKITSTGIINNESINYYKDPGFTFTVASSQKSDIKKIIIYDSADFKNTYREYTSNNFELTKPTTSNGPYIYTCTIDSFFEKLSNSNLYVIVSNEDSNSSAIPLAYNDVNKYTEDKDSPDVSSAVISTVSTEKTYYDSNSEKVYFNSSQKTITLNVTGVTDSAVGYFNCSIGTEAVMPESEETAISITNPDTTKSYKVYAWDKLGNYSEVKTINFVKDESVAAITGMTLSSTDDSSDFYYNSDNKELFWKNTPSIKFTASHADSETDIDYYYYNEDNEANRSATGEFTIIPSDSVSEYKFYAVDKVGNVSTAYTITSVKDTTSPAMPEVKFGAVENIYPKIGSTSTNVTANQEYVINYSTYATDGLTITVTSSDGGSGLKSITISSEKDKEGNELVEKTSSIASTSNTDTSFTLKPTDYTVYTVTALDEVNNANSVDIIINPDKQGPQPSGTSSTAPNYGGGTVPMYDSDGDGLAEDVLGVAVSDGSYTATDTISQVYGSGLDGGSEFTTNFYDEGLQLKVPISSEDIEAFGLVTGPSSSEDPDKPAEWTSISASNYSEGILTVTVPEITDEYSFIFLWMKDRVNNMSVFNLGSPSDFGINWWMQNKPSTGSVSYSVNAGNFAKNSTNAEATVTVTISGLSTSGAINTINFSDFSSTKTYTDENSEEKSAALEWAISSINFETNNGTYTVDSTNAKLDVVNTDNTATISFQNANGNPHPYLHTKGIVTVNLTCTSTDTNLINLSAPEPKVSTIMDFGGGNVTANTVSGKIGNVIARGLSRITSKVRRTVGFTSKTRVEKASSNKAVSSEKQKSPVKVAEIHEIPTSAIQNIPEFQSEDIEAQLNRSFQAGSIDLDKIVTKDNQSSQDNLKKNHGSIQNVAPLFVDDANNSAKLDNRVNLSKADEILEVSKNVTNVDWILIITVLVGVVIFVISAVSMIRRLTKKGE